MTFTPDESQKHALLTWYSLDHPLHFDARHPAIALAGEAGELLDLFKKNEYKPNFSWWNCKHCGYGDASHSNDDYKVCLYLSKTDESIMRGSYTSLILDELGDYSYYLRILAYLKKLTFEELCEEYNPKWYSDDLLKLLSSLNWESACILSNHAHMYNDLDRLELTNCTGLFLAILSKLDTTLHQVLDLNYKKLNSDPTNHGWKNATIKTIDDCPRMSEFY